MDDQSMGTPHTPRIEIPVLIDDAGLSPYAFRLYAHIKRKAGDDGSCYEGTRTIAEVCRMSVGQVSKAKAELRAAGLVTFEKRMTKGGLVDEIRPVDVWATNAERYPSVHTVNTNEPTVQDTNTNPAGVQEVNASGVSVQEVNTKQENSGVSVHHMNESRSLDISNDLDSVGVASDDASPDAPKVKKPKEPATPIAIRLVIADACLIDLEGGMTTKGQITNLNATAKTIWTNAQKQGKTEAECLEAIRYVSGWIKRTVYPYSNGQPLKPAAILDRWRAAMDAKPKAYANGTNGHHVAPVDPGTMDAAEMRRQMAELMRAGGGK